VDAAYTLFDTALGRCGIAWRDGSVIGFALPGGDDDATLARLARRHRAEPGNPPPFVVTAMNAVRQLLTGTQVDLTDIPVSLDVSDFERAVYEALRRVPPGETVTYGALAERVGSPGAAQAVGMAMGRNPIPVIIPCHRVLAGSGKTGGFSAPGGVVTKFRILEIEQAGRREEGLLFDDLPLAVKR
jgi:methylated-DNA-[protein]-cysteine S-methyltransferase